MRRKQLTTTRWTTIAVIALCIIAAGGFGFASATHEHGERLEQINERLRDQLVKERKELRKLRRYAAPILRPTPAGNRLLARRYFAHEYECAAEIISGETAGTWDHLVWNYEGSGAFGLGQARPRSKMLPFAYAGLHPYENPMPQLVWFDNYAKLRYGGVCKAAAHWTPSGSW